MMAALSLHVIVECVLPYIGMKSLAKLLYVCKAFNDPLVNREISSFFNKAHWSLKVRLIPEEDAFHVLDVVFLVSNSPIPKAAGSFDVEAMGYGGSLSTGHDVLKILRAHSLLVSLKKSPRVAWKSFWLPLITSIGMRGVPDSPFGCVGAVGVKNMTQLESAPVCPYTEPVHHPLALKAIELPEVVEDNTWLNEERYQDYYGEDGDYDESDELMF